MESIFRPFTLEWWQTGIFKFALMSIGILLAVYFPTFFKKYKNVWWLIAIVGSIYLIFVWLNQAR